MEELKKIIRDVPDFPKPGIIFKDITTLVGDGPAFNKVVNVLAERYADKNIDAVLAIESRGFIFGAPLAYKLGAGFVIVRKPGKLPAETVSVTYELEYGTDTLEMHIDAIKPGQRILVIDDLLATGGTASAAAQMVEQVQGELVELAFVVELDFLKGREKLLKYPVYSMLHF